MDVIDELSNKLIDARHFLSEEQYQLLLEGRLDVNALLKEFDEGTESEQQNLILNFEFTETDEISQA